MAEPEKPAAAAELPQDALLVKEVLESMGVTEYEPRVLQQLMDFMYRYTAEILQDAEAISERTGAPRGEVSLPDVMLAVQSRAQHSFVQPPTQQVLARVAAQHNRRPLPELRADKHGLRLPPEVDCLLAPNYQLQPRTPEGAPAPAPPQQAQQQAGGVSLAVRQDHKIQIKAPAALPPPQPEAAGGGGAEAGGGWVDQAAQAAAQAAEQAAQDDIDMMFEDI